jgi:hypothetical protein
MASPEREGTLTSSVFSSHNIDILSEIIVIKADKDFKSGKFIVEYTIKCDSGGKQIPLLFYAQDYRDSFSVWVDNKNTAVKNIPWMYTHFEDSPFSDFKGSVTGRSKNSGSDEVTIYWTRNVGHVYTVDDLKYFEIDLKTGIHKIRVEYTADAWINKEGWIKEYSFRYSLSPAKYWKSFGSLKIILEQEDTVRQLETNLGLPDQRKFAGISTWTFNKLPDEYFKISYFPDPGKSAQFFISLGPSGLSLIALVILFVLHFKLVLAAIKKRQRILYLIVLNSGIFLVPFLVLLIYMLSFGFIDFLIGKEAGNHHGYVFLVFVFYPLIVPVYWFVFKTIKKYGISDEIGAGK